MDCVESPYTWGATRKCTYEYSIEGSSTSESTYIKIARTFTELYFVGDAIDMGISTDTLPRVVMHYNNYIDYPPVSSIQLCRLHEFLQSHD